MSADSKPLIGRASTPAPPNVGTSSLASVMGFGTDPTLQRTRMVHGIATPALRGILDESDVAVFPSPPGLAVEALEQIPARAVVIEGAALDSGPWAGALGDIAPELAEQVSQLIRKGIEMDVPVYWVSRVDAEKDLDGSRVESVDTTGTILVAPGSPMFDGPAEGAPSSVLVTCLRRHIIAVGGVPHG